MSPTPFSITTPLPPDELLFEAMSHVAELSALEETQLQLLSEKAEIEAEKLLGRPVKVTILLRDGAKRYVNGYVTRFGIGTHQDKYFGYQATVRPWLWFLTRTSDCRIFQDLSVPDIVKQVFDDHGGLADYAFKLTRSYRKRGYCVQYRESDFDFVARLLEDEGIYWHFKHADGSHQLVMLDDASEQLPVQGTTTLPHYDDIGQVPPDTEFVSDWHFARAVQPGQAALTSYDFERPSTRLLVEEPYPRAHALSTYETFDFQGDYIQKADGKQLALNRIEEHQCQHDVCGGTSNGHTLCAGEMFTLARHPRADQNQEYLLTAARLAVRHHGSWSAGEPGSLQCRFEAIPASQQFRPLRRTRRPVVQGPQTAVVTGPGGDEIHTDKYGRVKVQFHWDRYGRKDERASCWVRVASPWAGKSFGFVQIPRIGQEVVVDFLEGDPDQPLVTGRVYNAENMPPWELPAHATQSGVLTRSSKGGAYANANALRFEDKKGSEQLWLHAEKNQDIEVENDETHWVGHDRTKTVDHDETVHVKHDRTETVDNNETITIGVDRTESVGNDETIAIGSNRSETVGSNESISIGANRSENVGANESIVIGGNRSISVGGSETATVALQRTHAVGVNETIAVGAAQEIVVGAAQTVAVGAAQTINVGAKQSNSIGADRTLTVGGAQSTRIGKSRSTSVADDDGLQVGKNLVIEAGDSVVLKTGAASITMKKDGTILIKGKDITIDGSGKVTVKAGGDIVMKGSKILQN